MTREGGHREREERGKEGGDTQVEVARGQHGMEEKSRREGFAEMRRDDTQGKGETRQKGGREEGITALRQKTGKMRQKGGGGGKEREAERGRRTEEGKGENKHGGGRWT